MHTKNSLQLENEPKSLDPRKLTSIHIFATKARESILGHNRILWTSGGYAGNGEELRDLGIQEASDGHDVNQEGKENSASLRGNLTFN